MPELRHWLDEIFILCQTVFQYIFRNDECSFVWTPLAASEVRVYSRMKMAEFLAWNIFSLFQQVIRVAQQVCAYNTRK